MTVNYITEPIPSAMGKGKGGWRGKIVGRSARSLEDIAAAVAKRTGWSAYQVQSVFTGVMEETIRDAQETGRTQQLGDYGSLKLNLRGRFEGIDDAYDPARHTLAFSFTQRYAHWRFHSSGIRVRLPRTIHSGWPRLTRRNCRIHASVISRPSRACGWGFRS